MLMNSFKENDEENQKINPAQLIWLKSVYWGIVFAFVLYAVAKDFGFYSNLRSYFRHVLPGSGESVIFVLSFFGASLLLLLAAEVFKYLFFGKNLLAMISYATAIVVLHAGICVFGIILQPQTAKNGWRKNDSKIQKVGAAEKQISEEKQDDLR